MDDLSNLLKQNRAVKLLQIIMNQDKQLMPCGEQRLASLLLRFGAVTLKNPHNLSRKFTTDFTLTQKGINEYERARKH